MTDKLSLPDTPSLATPAPDGRMFAPSAARNIGPICDVVAQHAPDTGPALEIASGTGEHIAALAQRLPDHAVHREDVLHRARGETDGTHTLAHGLGLPGHRDVGSTHI